MTSSRLRPSRVRAYIPAALWAILIFSASSIPSNAMPHYSVLTQDKLIHAGIYSVLGFLVYHGIRTRNAGRWEVAGWLTFAIGVFYGASDEFHQHFVPGRSMDIFDLLADAVGVACAIGLARYLERRHSRPT